MHAGHNNFKHANVERIPIALYSFEGWIKSLDKKILKMLDDTK